MSLTNKEKRLLTILNWCRDDMSDTFKVSKPNIVLDANINLDGYMTYNTDTAGLMMIHIIANPEVERNSEVFCSWVRLDGGINAIEVPHPYGEVIKTTNNSLTQKYNFDDAIIEIIKKCKEKKIPLRMKCGNDVLTNCTIDSVDPNFLTFYHLHAEHVTSNWGWVKKSMVPSFIGMISIPLHFLYLANIPDYIPKGFKEYYNEYVSRYKGDKFIV